MGWARKLRELKHLTEEQAPYFFRDFFWWHRWYQVGWKRYPISEHIKFIVEITPNPIYVGRSIFRSNYYYTDIEELENIQWWIGYMATIDPKTLEVNIIHKTPPLTEEEFRDIYKQHQGKGNW